MSHTVKLFKSANRFAKFSSLVKKFAELHASAQNAEVFNAAMRLSDFLIS